MVRGGEQLRGRQRQQVRSGELKKRQTSSSLLYFAVYGCDTGKQGDRRRPRHGGDTRTGRWPLSETQLQKIKRLAAICLAVPTSNPRLFCVAALFFFFCYQPPHHHHRSFTTNTLSRHSKRHKVAPQPWRCGPANLKWQSGWNCWGGNEEKETTERLVTEGFFFFLFF